MKAKKERVGLHVRLPADLVRRLRVRAAETDQSIQQLVETAVRAAVRERSGGARDRESARG